MVFGGNDNDEIFGGDDGDIIQGGSGDDVIRGEAGDDTLYAGSGTDSLYGGDGDDQLRGNGTLLGRFSGGAGHDTLSFQGSTNAVTIDLVAAATATDLKITTIEVLKGSETAQNTLKGTDNADELVGGDANDVLSGREGDDILRGGGAADEL